MNEQDLPDPPGQAAAEARQREIAALYDTLKRMIHSQLDALGDLDTPPTKALVTRIGELSAVHLILLKAEEAFREKFIQDDPSVLDHDALRDQIRRQLDRIRAADTAGSFPK
ncbi:hypothetical protein [Loktanella sp. SALINAS62]|uniref:hypothetical protein n=1 Tax=Loktanella sp. SALINAS62 TaxID=2706124 RepID=UPI001B8CBF67|nr:hypothetical protein [Loktanella sp. SALINAS62]MBS1303598.1 hypothetical protein [Loktanella sp. SALINAS62]